MAHGTPRRLEDLEGFLTAVRRGRPAPPALVEELRRRYEAIGGTSPLNERTAAQVAGIAAALDRLAPGRWVVAAGAKFASPTIEDALGTLAAAGVRRVVGIVMAPQSSPMSVGEYVRRAEGAAGALEAAGTPLELQVVDHWHDHPALATLLARRVHDALATLPAAAREAAVVLFTAHSLPARVVDQGDPYPGQVADTAAAVARVGGITRWRVAWQSAGRTDDAWLGPDVREVIGTLGSSGATGVVVCPVGFVADHLEVLYDIDVEARAVAEEAGVAFARTASLDDDPEFCEMLAQVVAHRADTWDADGGS